MSGFFTPPQFVPPQPPIPIGTNGQVLTNVSGKLKMANASGGGGVLTGRVAYASPAGQSNDVTPAGFGTTTGRLVVTLPSGDATWTGLLAGQDGQLLIITNADAGNTLTLSKSNGASMAANQFLYAFDLAIATGVSVLLIYDSTIANWLIV